MAKFCKFCGSPLEEGQVCSCQEAQAEAAAQAAPVATATEEPSAGKVLLESLKSAVLGYWKSPKNAAAAVVADKNNMALAGIFAGVNALAVFFYIWKFLGQIEALVSSVLGALSSLVATKLEISYPIFPMLLSGIVIAAVGIALTALTVYAVAKLNKQEVDLKNLIMSHAVHSIVSSALLLVGVLLGFISWQAQIIVLTLIVVQWFLVVGNDLREVAGVKAMSSGKNLLIQTIVITVAYAIIVFAIAKLAGWCFNELAIGEQTIGEMLDGMGDLSGLLGDIF